MMSPEELVLDELLFGGELSEEGFNLDPCTAQLEESSTTSNVSLCEPIVCAGCGEQVCDRFFLLAAGRFWHLVCLRCSQCHCELQTHPSLYWKDGNIYCHQDYTRIFGGGQCARCLQSIPPSALVMRSGQLTFHPHCFSCQECDVKLLPGNLYYMRGQNLYCQSHYYNNGDVLLPQDAPLNLNVNDTNLNQVSGEGEDSISSSEPQLDDRVADGRSRRRTKRIRTCFRSEQLRALESYFAHKHNPDGKDWTVLAHKTGLPKRVLQVWFQNARAKLRRSLNSFDSQVNFPAAPTGALTMPTSSSPPPCSLLDQLFPASTIDHLQFSQLTALISEPSASSVEQLLQSPTLNYNSQDELGCISGLENEGEFGEAVIDVETEDDAQFSGEYC